MHKSLLATLILTFATSAAFAQQNTIPDTPEPFIPPLNVNMTLLEQSPALASITHVTSETTTVQVTSTGSTTLVSSTTTTHTEHTDPHMMPTTSETIVTEKVEESIKPVVVSETAAMTPDTSATVTTTTSQTTILTPVSDTLVTTIISETTTTTSSQTMPLSGTEVMTMPMPACPEHTMEKEIKGYDNASTRNYAKSAATMHKNMDITYTGDSDIDFLRGMIAHHQAAVDMAHTVLEYGKDAQIRRLAKDIISAQNREIVTMQKWLLNLEKKGPKISSDMPRSGNWTDENWVGEGWLNER